MLKKRSIATMMAAATVATSVAPVFAATIVKETVKKGSDEQKALVNDLRKLLAEGTKFEVVGNGSTNKVGDSVYEIRTTSGTVESLADFEDESLVGNVLELEKRIEALKDDEYFVLGDNREVSKDSRMIGPVKKEQILGKTRLVIFPFTKIRIEK